MRKSSRQLRAQVAILRAAYAAELLEPRLMLAGDGIDFPGRMYDVGGDPNSVAAGDFNGDGRIDLAVTNQTSNNVSILRNNGDGTFAAAVNYATGTKPVGVTAADFNGDGKIDLAVTNSNTNNVSVLRNSGDGTFSAAVNYATGTKPVGVTAADFDGDGRMDLAVANYTSNNVSILRNNGDGTFAAAVNYATDSGPISLVAADINNDGRADLAVANDWGYNVSLLRNSGDGTFAAAVNYATGYHPISLVAADFNGDGSIDLATANNVSNGNNVSILRNNGDGTFAAAVNYAAGSYLYSVTAADFNRDGRADLAVAFGSGVSVLRNNGDGSFAAAVNYAAGLGPRSLVVADFNRDGLLELAVANFDGDNVSVLRNNGDGTFASAANYATGTLPQAVTAADFDGDGRMDLAVANYTSDNVSVLRNNGNGTFTAAVNYSVGSRPRSVTAADFNGDGRIDLAIANDYSNNVSILRNNGNGTFAASVNYNVAGSRPSAVTAADFNGDGRIDLAVTNSIKTISVLRNNGNGTFAAAVGYGVGFGLTSLVAADFNGDGQADLAAGGSGGVLILRNNGNGTFASAVNYAAGSYTTVGVTAADFNGDGRADLAVAIGGDNLPILRNNGDGTFAAAVYYACARGSYPLSVTAADFNGDGDIDLAAVGANMINVLRNRGDGTFVKEAYPAESSAKSITAADLDGDGRVDLAMTNSDSNSVSVLRNNGATSSPVDFSVLPAGATSPGAATVGDHATFAFTVQNTAAAALGNWLDGIYLSTDATWDLSDVRITSVKHLGGLAAGGSYRVEVSATIPAVLPGEYFVLFRADAANRFVETNEANNTAVATARLQITIARLNAGIPESGALVAGQAAYYQFTPTTDSGVKFTLDGSSASARHQLWVRAADVPVDGKYDWSPFGGVAEDQSVTIPTVAGVTYYLRVARVDTGDPPTAVSYTLTATPIALSLDAVDMPRVGMGSVTIEVRGYGLTQDTRFELITATGKVFEGIAQFADSTFAFVTFDLRTADVGMSSLRAIQGVLSTVLASATQIVQASTSQPMLKLSGPTLLRANTGNGQWNTQQTNLNLIDQKLPVLMVDLPNATFLSTSISRSNLGNRAVMLGIPQDRFAGAIRPGQASEAQFLGRLSASTSGRFGIVKPSSLSQIRLDYTSLLGNRPFGGDPVRWQEYIDTLRDQYGETLADYFSYQSGAIAQSVAVGGNQSVSLINGRFSADRIESSLMVESPHSLPNAMAKDVAIDSTSAKGPLAGGVPSDGIVKTYVLYLNPPVKPTGPLNWDLPTRAQSRSTNWVRDAFSHSYGVLPGGPQTHTAPTWEDARAWLTDERTGIDGDDNIVFYYQGHSTLSFPQSRVDDGNWVMPDRTVTAPDVSSVLQMVRGSGTSGKNFFMLDTCGSGPMLDRLYSEIPNTLGWSVTDPESLIGLHWIPPDVGSGFSFEFFIGAWEGLSLLEIAQQMPYSVGNWQDASFQDPSGFYQMLLRAMQQLNREDLECPVDWGTAVVRAWDPNDIVAPAGSGSNHYVKSDERLSYTIRFENDVNLATAPAQSVQITQKLDADLDWSTFELQSFGFGANQIDVPSGRADYSTRLDLRSTVGLFVDLSARFDSGTGTITWDLKSVNPATGELPTDPLAGFLPVNRDGLEGQGWVNYSIRPRSAVTTGTRVDAQGMITFDANDPIYTPIAFNTVDAGTPTSQVSGLPTSIFNQTSFTVTWTGADDIGGSGVANYDIYVSDNGGPWTLWLDNSAATSATFTGQLTHAYGFYSVATDAVGWTEAPPAAADATTTLVDSVPPTILYWASAANHQNIGVGSLLIHESGTFSEPREGGLKQLLIYFSEPIDPATFTATSVQLAGNDANSFPVDLSGITIATSFQGADTVCVIDFSSALPDYARYLARIVGVKDVAGNNLAGDNDRIITALKGDVSGDLRVDVTDLSRIQGNYANPINFANEAQVRADVSLDGRANVTDLSRSWANRNHDARFIADPVIAAPAPVATGSGSPSEPVSVTVDVPAPDPVPLTTNTGTTTGTTSAPTMPAAPTALPSAPPQVTPPSTKVTPIPTAPTNGVRPPSNPVSVVAKTPARGAVTTSKPSSPLAATAKPVTVSRPVVRSSVFSTTTVTTKAIAQPASRVAAKAPTIANNSTIATTPAPLFSLRRTGVSAWANLARNQDDLLS